MYSICSEYVLQCQPWAQKTKLKTVLNFRSLFGHQQLWHVHAYRMGQSNPQLQRRWQSNPNIEGPGRKVWSAHFSSTCYSLTLIYRVPVLALTTPDSLKVYRKSNDQLTAFNDFSTARFTEVQKHLEIHTKLIKEIKTDLDAAFRKIR